MCREKSCDSTGFWGGRAGEPNRRPQGGAPDGATAALFLYGRLPRFGKRTPATYSQTAKAVTPRGLTREVVSPTKRVECGLSISVRPGIIELFPSRS